MKGEHQPVNDQPTHGSPPDEQLENGPITDRSCQDCLCFILFAGATVAFIVILSMGFSQGHPERLTYAYDPDNRACGEDAAVINAPYIYLASPYSGFFNRSVCVSSCPNWPSGTSEPTSLQCVVNSIITSCNIIISDGTTDYTNVQNKTAYDFINILKNISNFSINKLMNHSTFIYNSTAFLNRICIPSGSDYIANITKQFSQNIDLSTADQWVNDVYTTYPIIIASAGIAIALAIIYFIMIRYLAGFMTWLAILLYFISLALFIYYFYDKSLYYQTEADRNTANNIPDSDNSPLQTYRTLRGFMIAFIVIAVISLCAFCCYFNKIRMAIAIIKTAALFVVENPLSILIPPVFMIITVGFWAFWIVTFLYIYSMGDINGSSSSPFASVTWNENIRYYLIYHLFYGLWGNAIIQAFSQFILASAVCLWFYQNGGQLIHAPILESVYRSFRYHIGSLIFGGLLLAIVQFIRFWLEYINQQMKQAGGDKAQPLKCLLDCCRCLAACFERFVSFINKNAYIQIALTGASFITAAKNAFYLFFSNAGQFMIVSGIGSVFCNLCKLFIAFSTTFICYIIITSSSTYKNQISSPILPTILFFLISWVIGDLFMGVYGMAIDTTLQCAITQDDICTRKRTVPKNIPAPIKELLDGEKAKHPKK